MRDSIETEANPDASPTHVKISIDESTSKPPLEIHEVCLPPHVTTLKKLKHRLREIFLHDDPLHIYKNQTLYRKLVLGVQYIFPIFQWAPNITFRVFRSDLLAGLTIASLAIPQGIAYAQLAYLPPIIGLYSSFVPPLIYALLGSSRHLGIGPVSIASLVMGTMLSEMVSPVKEPHLYRRLALTSTLVGGLFQAALGFFRLGFLVEFLSKATLIGFMAGAAVIVALQQLKGLFGIQHFTAKMQLIPVVESIFGHRNEWSCKTIVLGFSFLVFLLGARKLSATSKKLFWVSAAAPLTSIVLSTILIFALRSKFQEISIIGWLPEGVNPPSVNMLYFHGPYLHLIMKTGIVCGILALTEGIAVGRTFASMENYTIDGNKEMGAIGVMNIVGSCCSCYIATGSFSRSAVNYNAGGRTALSNIIMAATVLVTLLFLMPLFYYTPNLILAGIIITAVVGLIDYEAMFKLWKLDKLDFVACLCSFFGVLFVSVQIGLLIAVGVSIFKIILHVTRPNTVVLGNIQGTPLYRSLARYESTLRVPSFLILSIESPIFFSNSSYLQARILRWIREEEGRIEKRNDRPLKCVILDMTAVTGIDTSGVDAVADLKYTLNNRSLQLVLVNPVGTVMEKLHYAKVLELFASKGLYLTIAEAVADLSSSPASL